MLSNRERGRNLSREAAVGMLRHCSGCCRDLVVAIGEVEIFN
jgi:hypothetical protein